MTTAILAIDDSADDRRLYQRAFKDFNGAYTLVMASSAADGFARIAAAPPDLILLDYNLPDMDGLSFIKELSENVSQPIPVVMLTGEGNATVAVEAMKNGVDDYIVKDTGGEYLKLLPGVVGHVMTAHAQREQSRRLRQETETLLRRNQMLMQNSMDGIHVMDMQGNLVEANDAFCQMLGYSREEALRLNVADWDAQWTREELREKFKELVGSNARIETMHRRKDGALIDVEISVSAIEIEKQVFMFAASRDITERKRVEEKLRLGTQLLNSTSDSVFLFDLDGKFVYLNEAAWKSRGYTQDELMAMNVRELNTPEFSKLVAPRIKEVLEKGQGVFDAEHRCKDGSTMSVEVSSRVIESGGRKLLLSASRDITERKKTEAMLIQHKQVIDTSIDGFWISDMSGNLLEANQAYAKISGYTVEELMHMHISQLEAIELKPEDVHAHIAKVVAQGYDRFETRHRHKDGHEIGIEVAVTHMPESQLLFVFCRDITERKRAEGVLKLNKTIIETAHDGFWMYDTNGYLLDVNQAYAEMIGYTREELVGMHISRLSVQSNTPELVRARIGKAISQGAGNFETQHRHKDGHVMDFEASIAYIPEANCLFSFIRDITERKKAEAVLRRHKQVVDTSLDGFWINDLQGNLQEANQAYATMSGYTVEELAHMHISQLEAKEQAAEVKTHTAKIITQGHDRFVTRHRRKDGREFDVEVSATYIVEAQQIFAFFRDITERNLTEKALLKNEANMRAMLDNSPYLTWLKDTQGRYITINKVFAEYLRLADASQAAGKTDLDLQPKELAEKYRADDAAVMASRQQKHVEESAFDGKITHWVETYKTPIIDAYGKVRGTVGFARDITERKRMQLATEALLRRNLALMKTSMDGIHVLDMQGNVVEANDAFCQMLGYSREEAAHLNVADWAAEFSGEELRERFKDHIGKSFMIETIHRRKDGTLMNVEISITGEVIDGQGLLFCSSRDITERKKAEEKILLESRTERKRAEVLAQQFGHLLQNSFDEIYLFDAADLHYLQASAGAKKNLGYSDAELNQMTPPDIQPAFARESYESLLVPLRSGEQPSLLFATFQRRKDGTTYPVEVRVQLMEAEPPVFMAIAQDITERRRAESQLREFSAHLQTVREEEKASAAREIHDDLGGTLAALKMDAHWLARKLAAEAEMAPLLERTEAMYSLLDNAVKAMRRIVSNLRPTILDDMGLLEALKWQCAEFHKRTGIECRVVCIGGEDCEDGMDKALSINLFRIFQEALTNVARHSGASRVEVDLHKDEEEVILSVTDNGCGLPEGHAIAPTSHGIRGMRERAVQLGGKLEIDSPPGGGFSVTIAIPLAAGNKK